MENGHPIDNQMLLYKLSKYSDTIANGDASDDKELHEEEDGNDDVVDINGSGNYRFAMEEPLQWMVPATHIETGLGHFTTNPRDASPNQLQPGEASGSFGYGTFGQSMANEWTGSHNPQATLDNMGFYTDSGEAAFPQT
jgi:hypothetical protein